MQNINDLTDNFARGFVVAEQVIEHENHHFAVGGKSCSIQFWEVALDVIHGLIDVQLGEEVPELESLQVQHLVHAHINHNVLGLTREFLKFQKLIFDKLLEILVPINFPIPLKSENI